MIVVSSLTPLGQRHDLDTFISTRGEKVEIFHNNLAHYANGGCNPKLAQAVTLAGIIRFDMDHERTLQWQQDIVGDDKV